MLHVKLVGDGLTKRPTDRPMDIITYRTAIAAEIVHYMRGHDGQIFPKLGRLKLHGRIDRCNLLCEF